MRKTRDGSISTNVMDEKSSSSPSLFSTDRFMKNLILSDIRQHGSGRTSISAIDTLFREKMAIDNDTYFLIEKKKSQSVHSILTRPESKK